MWDDAELLQVCRDVVNVLKANVFSSEVARQLAARLNSPELLLLESNGDIVRVVGASRARQPMQLERHCLPEYWRVACDQQVPVCENTTHELPGDAGQLHRGLFIPLPVGCAWGGLCLANHDQDYTLADVAAAHWLAFTGGLGACRSVAHQDTSNGELLQPTDFCSIIDGTDAVIYCKRIDGRYEFINRKFEQIFALKREDVIGHTDEEVFANSPDLAQRFVDNDRLVVRMGQSVQFEETAPHVDGLHQYISVKFPLFTPDGHTRGIAGISTDITRRVQAEQTIQFLRDRNEEILKSVADGVVLLDRGGHVEYMNPAARNVLKYSCEQLKSSRFLELVMATDECGQVRNELSLPIFHSLQHQSQAVDVEDCFWCGDGTSLPVEYSAVPVIDDGRTEGAVITFRDIRLRLERRRTRRDLKAAQAMQRLLYPQSHPRLPGFDIAGAVFPASGVCGDYYDFVSRDEDRLALIVADATGHDLTSALLMVNARANFRSCLKTSDDIVTVLKNVNEILANELDVGKFVTTFLTELDARDQSMTYAGAGQSAELLLADGTSTSLKSGGLMLGIQHGLTFSGAVKLNLQVGDIVLICTDGLAETADISGDLLRMPRIIDEAQRLRNGTAHDILNGLIDLGHRHSGGKWPMDDATIVVVKTLDRGATW